MSRGWWSPERRPRRLGLRLGVVLGDDGRHYPFHCAQIADGTPFTTAELEKGMSTVMVFYRGRW